MSRPWEKTYVHDCDNCAFLGAYPNPCQDHFPGVELVDVYVCVNNIHGSGSIVVRYSDEPSKYWSTDISSLYTYCYGGAVSDMCRRILVDHPLIVGDGEMQFANVSHFVAIGGRDTYQSPDPLSYLLKRQDEVTEKLEFLMSCFDDETSDSERENDNAQD